MDIQIKHKLIVHTVTGLTTSNPRSEPGLSAGCTCSCCLPSGHGTWPSDDMILASFGLVHRLAKMGQTGHRKVPSPWRMTRRAGPRGTAL
jgi:hypothetical protein